MSGILWGVVVGAGAISAVLWLWSAMVPIPKGMILFTSHCGGGTPNTGVEAVMSALRRQSKLSAAAAGFAAVSIGAQVAQRVLGLS